MPYTWEDFRRDIVREYLDRLPPEERVKGLPPEERVKGLPPEERVKGLSPEERVKGLSPEEIEEIREYLEKLKSSQHQQPSKN